MHIPVFLATLLQCGGAGGAGGRDCAGGVPQDGGQHPAPHRQRTVVRPHYLFSSAVDPKESQSKSKCSAGDDKSKSKSK